MHHVVRARWVVPIDRPPIDGGWVEIAGDAIVGVHGGRPPASHLDLGDAAILPALVNAHTHLELSWMAGLVPPAASMPAWIRRLMAIRREGPEAQRPPRSEAGAARDAIAAVRLTGTGLVGDISNTGTTAPLLREAGIGGVVFRELIGFRHPNPDAAVAAAWDEAHDSLELAHSVVAHAPYSVSPELFESIVAKRSHAPLAVHLAESTEEVEFIRTGRGPFRELLESIGVWRDDWSAPACGPVEYLRRLGYVRPGTLVVHGVHLTDDELQVLKGADAVVVTCPRSNAWVGSGSPPLQRFFGSGVRLAIGTDSLASAPTLNIFDELAEMHRIAPAIAPSKLLQAATIGGAHALGRARDHGTIEPGKRAALVAVDVPASTVDVEEWLVSPGEKAVRWVDGRMPG